MWVSGACARHLTKPDWRFGKTKGSAGIAQLESVCLRAEGCRFESGCQLQWPFGRTAQASGFAMRIIGCGVLKVAKIVLLLGMPIAEMSTAMSPVFDRVWWGD